MDETRVGCANADCVAIARELVVKGFNPAILNLASRRKPGGGYDSGKGAQEEYLCQTSTLSQSLYQYYKPVKCVLDAGGPLKYNAYPLDIRHGGIYSKNVTFFREGANKWYALREDPFACGVVTVAALSFREPNAYCNEERRYMSEDGGFTPEGESIQLDKIRTIFRIALTKRMANSPLFTKCLGGGDKSGSGAEPFREVAKSGASAMFLNEGNDVFA